MNMKKFYRKKVIRLFVLKNMVSRQYKINKIKFLKANLRFVIKDDNVNF